MKILLFLVTIGLIASCHQLDSLAETPNESSCRSLGFESCEAFKAWYSQTRESACTGQQALFRYTEYPIIDNSFTPVRLLVRGKNGGVSFQNSKYIVARRAEQRSGNSFQQVLDFVQKSPAVTQRVARGLLETVDVKFSCEGEYFYLLVREINGGWNLKAIELAEALPVELSASLAPGEYVEGLVIDRADEAPVGDYLDAVQIMAVFAHHYMGATSFREGLPLLGANCVNVEGNRNGRSLEAVKAKFTADAVVITSSFATGPDNVWTISNVPLDGGTSVERFGITVGSNRWGWDFFKAATVRPSKFVSRFAVGENVWPMPFSMEARRNACAQFPSDD